MEGSIMAWVKIENNIVIQKQPYQENGFVEVADDVYCGMKQVGDSFVIPPKTLEYALRELRQTRNSLLARTDWTANSDLVLSDEMKAYRKKLRDATTGLDTVEKIEAYEFPTEVLS